MFAICSCGLQKRLFDMSCSLFSALT